MSEWAAAWTAAWAELPEVVKTRKAKIKTKSGADYEYAYADLGDTLNAVRAVLTKHGLAVAQSVGGTTGQVAVTTSIIHKSGETRDFGPVVLAAGDDPRAAGSAITYARRYGLSAALGIATEDDDDGGRAALQDRPPAKRADWHERAWSHSIGLFGADPDVFLEAVGKAGVKGKAKNQAEFDAIVAVLDGLARGAEDG